MFGKKNISSTKFATYSKSRKTALVPSVPNHPEVAGKQPGAHRVGVEKYWFESSYLLKLCRVQLHLNCCKKSSAGAPIAVSERVVAQKLVIKRVHVNFNRQVDK